MTTGETRGSVPRAPRTPNRVLRGIRENERHESRGQFADAMAHVGREMGAEVYPDAQYVQRLESGYVAWPHRTYRAILERLCGRSARELGFAPSKPQADDSGEISSRVNARLREAIWESGTELTDFARKIGVDPKTAERWITRGMTPQPFRRWKASLILGIDESELWPDAPSRQELEDDRGRIQEPATQVELASRSETAFSPEDSSLVEQLRRTFLASGLAALTLPALGLDELNHIAAAVVMRSDTQTAISSITSGGSLTVALSMTVGAALGSHCLLCGLIAAIEKIATDAKPATRRDLLRIGAYASEFAGWLYRDVCSPELANYWRDRATEWAQVSGDATMQGYVLLKKSQAVWDERDAFRMLTLAEAAQEGPWRLPARVRAEAAQQQARGHAMLNGNLALVESKLGEARSLLAQDRAISDTRTTEVAAHYDEALFGLQVAICYCEAKQPVQSLELYERWLSPETFSRRDYAYFLALKGEAHAAAEEPDNAALAGLTAFSLARETESVRTVREIIRLAVQLEKWPGKDSVHELRKSVLVS